jgi:hypothetical protein
MLDLSHAPVSAKLRELLEAEIARAQIVVWLDPKGHYTAFVDALRDTNDWIAPVLAHRGSYLELMLALEDHASSVDKSPLLIHLPGPIDVKNTPMLEIYRAGKHFPKNIETLVREAAIGWLAPTEVDEFLASGKVGLAEADAWMAGKVLATEGELLVTLHAMPPATLVAALLDPHSPLREQLRARSNANDVAQVRRHIASRLGLPNDWGFPINIDSLERVGEAAAGWALCVEYVHDLRREPSAEQLTGIKSRLTTPLRDACFTVASGLREHFDATYEQVARDVEAWLVTEVNRGAPGDLGKIDTFRFEEEQLMLGALDALDADHWDDAATWARERLEGKSFWVHRDAARRNAWNLIADAAALGRAISGSKLNLGRAGSLAEATQLYVERGAIVDRRHRELEQQVGAQLFDRVPHDARLHRAIRHVRAHHARWQDAVARDWSALCEREGALPGRELQQRELFDGVVRPLLERDKTALFLVDALRFEMATELVEKLGGTPRDLHARLAELPSVTEIGMNAIAPVASAGKLRPLFVGKDPTTARRFSGFATTNFQVTDPDSRKKAIAARAGGHACPPFAIEDLVRMTPDAIRLSLRQAKLTLVISTQIDKLGESGAGPAAYASELLKIRAAWQLLREAGVNNFVITSDHGFMLRDKDGPTLKHGQGHDALARYALYDKPLSNEEQYSVALRSLQYEGPDRYLLFPRGCAVYSIAGDRTFVHGGNSPQERIIPVLTLEHKTPLGASDRRYELEFVRVGSFDGMHYIDAILRSAADQKGLQFTDPESVDFDVRVRDAVDVQAHTNQAGKDAHMRGGVVFAKVGAEFRLIFRITGPRDARVQVELFHPSGAQSIAPLVIVERRFEVTEARVEPASKPEPASSPAPVPTPAPTSEAPTSEVREAWLDTYEPSVRKVFAYIAKHNGINQEEATRLLGSPRAFRRFALMFDEWAARAPFVITSDMSSGLLRYNKRSEK